MNKRQIKKSMAKAALSLENRDNVQTADFLVGRVAELEDKCARYVLVASDLKNQLALGATAYDSVMENWKECEESNTKHLNHISDLKSEIAGLKMMNKQEKEMKNTYFNSLNKSIEINGKLDEENNRLSKNYKGCADSLDKSEKARRVLEGERDCLRQKVTELETELNKPWWKKVFSWL